MQFQFPLVTFQALILQGITAPDLMQQHWLPSLSLSFSLSLFSSLSLYSSFKFDIIFRICCTKSLFCSGRNSGYSSLLPPLSTYSTLHLSSTSLPLSCFSVVFNGLFRLKRAQQGNARESERDRESGWKLKFSALFAQLFVNNSVLSLAFGLIIFTVRADCKFIKVISPIPSLSVSLSLFLSVSFSLPHHPIQTKRSRAYGATLYSKICNLSIKIKLNSLASSS